MKRTTTRAITTAFLVLALLATMIGSATAKTSPDIVNLNHAEWWEVYKAHINWYDNHLTVQERSHLGSRHKVIMRDAEAIKLKNTERPKAKCVQFDGGSISYCM